MLNHVNGLNVSRPRRLKPSGRNSFKFGGSGSIHPEAQILSMRNRTEKDKLASLPLADTTVVEWISLNRSPNPGPRASFVEFPTTPSRKIWTALSTTYYDNFLGMPATRAAHKILASRAFFDVRSRSLAALLDLVIRACAFRSATVWPRCTWTLARAERAGCVATVCLRNVRYYFKRTASLPNFLLKTPIDGKPSNFNLYATTCLGERLILLQEAFKHYWESCNTAEIAARLPIHIRAEGSVDMSKNPEFLWFPVRFATLDYSGGILAARFRIPYQDVDELEVARHVTERSLTTQPIIARFAPDNAHAIRLARGGIQATSSSDLRGRLYLELSLRELFRRRLPPVVLRPLVEEIVKVVEKVLDTSGSAHHLQRLIGTMAEAGGNEGYDCAMRFLEERLEDVLENLWERCMEFVDRVDLLVQPVDRLHKLLLRLRKFTDDQTSRPVRVADLHPAVADNKAPSKRSLCDQSPFLTVADAHPDLPQFLQAVADMEILSDGVFPCILPSMQEHAWAPLLETTIGRPSMVALGQRVLHAFVVDLILERLKRGGGSADAEILLPILTSNRTLLNSLFRMGVYQEVSSCPFDGSEASYPATAMRLYWAMLQENSLGHHDIVKTAVRNTFEVLVDVLFDAHRFHMEHTANAEALSPKKRKILAPTQGIDMAKDNIPQAPGRENAPPVHPRRAGRTTIPTIVIARRKPAASTSSDSMPRAPTAHLASSLA
ncbi:hypothetical protein DFH06DRAFT_1149840 [Mycena polygramma]|nr:hypothetical protein DFH06DRAFT_1149840 [Mycena polygramma]